jgi:hypothetical protein
MQLADSWKHAVDLADLSGNSASLRIRGLVQRRDDRQPFVLRWHRRLIDPLAEEPVRVGRPDVLGHATDDMNTTRGATPSESHGSHAARENRRLEHDDWHKRCFAAWTERLICDVARDCKRQRASLLASLPGSSLLRSGDPFVCSRHVLCEIHSHLVEGGSTSSDRSIQRAGSCTSVDLESLPDLSRCSRVILKPFSTRMRSDLEMTTRCKGPSNMQ